MEFVNNLHEQAIIHNNSVAAAICKLLCIRVNYKDVKRSQTGCYMPQRCIMPDVEWLIKGKALDVMIFGDMVNGRSDTTCYETRNGRLVSKNNAQNSTVTELFCCGCRLQTDNETYEPANRSTKNQLDPFAELMKIFSKINSRDRIGHLTMIIDSSLDEQNGKGYFKHTVQEPLENAKLKVSLLELKVIGGDPVNLAPILELIQFEHLVIMSSEPLILTPKILNCGLLFLDVPIVNPEDIEKFNGFALLLGKAMENNFNLDSVNEQINKYKENIPSKIEFIGVFEPYEWVSDKLIERLMQHSFEKDDDFSKPTALCRETIIRLDRDDEAAILIRGKKSVVFARNGWRKWQKLLEGLWFRY